MELRVAVYLAMHFSLRVSYWYATSSWWKYTWRHLWITTSVIGVELLIILPWTLKDFTIKIALLVLNKYIFLKMIKISPLKATLTHFWYSSPSLWTLKSKMSWARRTTINSTHIDRITILSCNNCRPVICCGCQTSVYAFILRLQRCIF